MDGRVVGRNGEVDYGIEHFIRIRKGRFHCKRRRCWNSVNFYSGQPHFYPTLIIVDNARGILLLSSSWLHRDLTVPIHRVYFSLSSLVDSACSPTVAAVMLQRALERCPSRILRVRLHGVVTVRPVEVHSEGARDPAWSGCRPYHHPLDVYRGVGTIGPPTWPAKQY